MMRFAMAAALTTLALVRAAAADGLEAVRDVEVRPGVTARVLIHRAGFDKPMLVLLPGGDGHIFITPDGIVAEDDTFLIRARRLFWQQGMGTIVVDAPTDRHDGAGLREERGSAWHAQDLAAVAKDIAEGARVWLVGASRGAISAANALARTRGVFAGGMFLSTPTVPGRARDVTVFDVDLASINQRVLLVYHEADTCRFSPPDMLDRLAFELTAARVDRAVVGGGLNAGANPCRALSHHSFFGSEKEAVAAIAEFARRR